MRTCLFIATAWILLNVSPIHASPLSQPASRPLELTQKGFQEAVLNYMLLASFATPEEKIKIFDRMKAFVARYADPSVETRMIRQPEDLKAYDFHAQIQEVPLAKRIEWLEDFTALQPVRLSHADPQLAEKELQDYGDSFLTVFYLSAGLKGLGEVIGDPQKLLRNLSGPGHDDFKLMVVNSFEKAFAEALGKIDEIGDQMATSSELQLDDEKLKIMLQLAMQNYFEDLSIENKKAILSAILPLGLNAKPMDFLPHFIANFGPHFQKMIQALARQSGLGDQAKALFKQMEKKAPPVAWWYVRQILASKWVPFEWISIDPVPLGTGSIAQVHRAKILYNGKVRDVVVRILKPGVQERAKEDGKILDSLAEKMDRDPRGRAMNLPKLADYVDDIEKTVDTEFDEVRTENLQRLAGEIYPRKEIIKIGSYRINLYFEVPQVIPTPDATGISVQDFVPGERFSDIMERLSDAPAQLRQKVAESLARLWWRAILHEGGLFHGDLHQGNFLIRQDKDGLHLSIIDYGMGGIMNQEFRDAFVMSGAGLLAESPAALADGLWRVRDAQKTTTTWEEFSRKLKDEMLRQQTRGTLPSFEDWIKWSALQGIKFSSEFLSIRRSAEMLNLLLKSVGSDYEMDDIAKEVAREHFVNDGFTLLRSMNFTPRQLARLGDRATKSVVQKQRAQLKSCLEILKR